MEGTTLVVPAWWGEMTLVGHFWRVLQLSAIEADVTFGELMEPCADRKALAADLRSAIVAARRPRRADQCPAAYNLR